MRWGFALGVLLVVSALSTATSSTSSTPALQPATPTGGELPGDGSHFETIGTAPGADRLPVHTLVDARIQPGAWMAYPGWCTFNFVFQHRGTGTYGIGTAGHCVEHIGQEVWLQSARYDADGDVSVHPPEPSASRLDPARCVEVYPIDGPGIGYGLSPGCVFDQADRVGLSEAPATQGLVLTAHPIGHVVEARNLGEKLGPDGVGNDFALVEIDPAYESLVDPRIDTIGGPCGVYAGDLSHRDEPGRIQWLPEPDAPTVTDPPQSMPLAHAGHGIGTGTGGTPRVGLGEHPSPHTTGTQAHPEDAIMWKTQTGAGDSGAPVRAWNGSEHRFGEDLGAFVDGAGQAVGILTHRYPLGGPDAVANGWKAAGTSIDRVLEIAGPDWQLVSSPDCPVLR